MILYAINGSPRKKWNDDQLLDSMVCGVKAVCKDIEVRKINLYDYTFKGCISCFACKLVGAEPVCAQKDKIGEVLREIKESDGLILASPIYFKNVSGAMRCFMERLVFPGKFEKEVKLATIFTMNETNDIYQMHTKSEIDTFVSSVASTLRTTEYSRTLAFDTLMRKDEEKYKQSHFDHKKKSERHLKEWPGMLEQAYTKGKEFGSLLNRTKTI